MKHIAKLSENIGEKIDHVCRIIERENPDLDGVLTNTKYNDKRKYPDDKLRQLISHFNSPRLRNSDLEREDIFGDAYEYLLEKFAEQTKKRGGEFFTLREVVRLLVNLVEPKEGMGICDPTCGSGGMLIESRKYVDRTGGDPRNLNRPQQQFQQPTPQGTNVDTTSNNNNPTISIADELAKLANLKKQGVITESEFQQMKQDLLKRH